MTTGVPHSPTRTVPHRLFLVRINRANGGRVTTGLLRSELADTNVTSSATARYDTDGWSMKPITTYTVACSFKPLRRIKPVTRFSATNSGIIWKINVITPASPVMKSSLLPVSIPVMTRSNM